MLIFSTETGEIVAVTPAVAQLFGVTAEQLLHKDIGQERIFTQAGIARLLQMPVSAEVVSFRVKLESAAGEKTLRFDCARDHESDPALVNCAIREVTAETSIADHERFFSMLKNGVTDYAIILMDLEGRIASWNAGAEQIFQYSESEVLGRHAALIFTAEDRERNRPEVEMETAAMHGRADDERWHMRKDGSRFMASGVLTAVVEDRRLKGYVKVLRDITDRMKADRLLQEAHQYQTLGVLAGGFAHDFNNLLTSVLGNTNLALDYLPPASPLVPLLQEAVSSSRRGADLIRQLLAYAGKGQVIKERLELSNVVGELLPLLRRNAPRHVVIESALLPGLPSFIGDPAQVDQMIIDLVTNAVEALDKKPGEVRITTGIAHLDHKVELAAGSPPVSGDFVYCEVADAGIGMDEKTLKRIFEPFFTTKFVGRGLGLAAVSGSVRQHGGAIAVSSKPGQGTTVRVYFPVMPGSVDSIA